MATLLTYTTTAYMDVADDDFIRLEINVAVPRNQTIETLYCKQIKVWLPVGNTEGSLSPNNPLTFTNDARWVHSSGSIVTEKEVVANGDPNQPLVTYYFDDESQGTLPLEKENFTIGFRIEKTKIEALRELIIPIEETSGKTAGDLSVKKGSLSPSLELVQPTIQSFYATKNGVPCTAFSKGEEIELKWEGSLIKAYYLHIGNREVISKGQNNKHVISDLTSSVSIILRGEGQLSETYQSLAIHITDAIVTDDIGLQKAHVEGKADTWEQSILFGDELNRLGAKMTAKREKWDGAPMQLAFHTGAIGKVTEQMTIKNNGNVGIGMNAPLQKLQVEGNAIISGWLAGKEDAGGAFHIYGSHKDPVGQQLTIKEGRVGLGTTNPQAILHLRENKNPSKGFSQDIIKLSLAGDIGNGPKGCHAAIALTKHDDLYNFPRTRIDFKTTGQNTDNWTTPVTVMSLKDDGNVGIGTKDPLQKLQVEGNAIISGWLAGKEAAGGAFYIYGSHKDPVGQQLTIKGGKAGLGTTEINEEFQLQIKGGTGGWKGGIAAGDNDNAVVLGELNKVATIGGHNAALKAWANLAINSHGGNVGIGHADPRKTFHVYGESLFQGKVWVEMFHDTGVSKGTICQLTHWQHGNINNFKSGPIHHSDLRLKKAVHPLSNALNKLTTLKGVSFEWNELGLAQKTGKVEDEFRSAEGTQEADEKIWETEKQRIREEHAGVHKGFIAQEVEEVFPEWVKDDDAGYKTINTSEMLPFLVEAIKEQQKQIELLQQQVATLMAEKGDME